MQMEKLSLNYWTSLTSQLVSQSKLWKYPRSTKPCMWHRIIELSKSTWSCATDATTTVCDVFTIRIVGGRKTTITADPMHLGMFLYFFPSFVLIELISRLLQDVANQTADICDSTVVKRKMIATWGQSLHLGCFLKMPAVLASQTITWYHYSKDKGQYKIVFR